MDLRQLHYFMEVASTLNMSRAADRVWISQPALSRQISLLEEELGVKLFERKARGVLLTHAGEIVKRRASVLLKEADELKEEISALTDEPAGLVRLAISSSLRTLLTKRVAASYNTQFPLATLNIKEGMSREMRDALELGEVDIAIFLMQEPSEQFICNPLLTEQIFAIGPTEAQMDLETPISVEELCSNPLILTAHPNSIRQIIERAASHAGVSVIPARLEVHNSTLQLDLVRSGLGYALLPYCALDEALQEGSISASPVKDLSLTWIIATSRDHVMSVATRKLLIQLFVEAEELVKTGVWRTATLCGPLDTL